jgi:hypothetical protein
MPSSTAMISLMLITAALVALKSKIPHFAAIPRRTWS